MTTRWPSSCYGAVSSVRRFQNAGARSALFRQQHGAFKLSVPAARRYATQREDDAAPRFETSALLAVTQQSPGPVDRLNPPRSTLPPPLKLPERAQLNIFMYWFRIGRAYGSFYWAGVKAVWFNRQAVQALRARAGSNKDNARGGGSGDMALNLTRAEYQLLQRNAHDISKLPFFGVLVMLLGEWLPLLVPFIPGAVPGTCRIPSQIRGMREKAEARRRVSFRLGIAEPARGQMQVASPAASEDHGSSNNKERADEEWPMARRAYAATLIARLRADQLHHLSSTLNLHSRLWDHVQLPPPGLLLRRALAARLAYLAHDDRLLARDGGAAKLLPDELMIACEQRGIDVLGRRDDLLRENLAWWLARQQDDRGSGPAMFAMLFRRPNAWEPPTTGEKQ